MTAKSAIETALLSPDVRQSLLETCRHRLPQETCGILLGRVRPDDLLVDSFTVIRNASPHANRAFSFDPRDWVRACYNVQKSRQLIVGCFHSHPDGTWKPSAEDLEGVLPWGTYWIIGLSAKGDKIAGYRTDSDGVWNPLRIMDREPGA